jgi:1-acyl-sn-glycerol-3-phosphate acyltransferase
MSAPELARIESLDADSVGRPESPWRALQRRFTGRYPIDAFGLDPQLADMVIPLFTFAVRVDVEGAENVPASGPAVVVANRAFGFVEPAALAIGVLRATGRRLRVVGAPTAPFLGSAARRFGAIGATPSDVSAALHAGYLVAVPLMPTWLRTSAGAPPHALMQAMTHSPIIPAAVTPVGPLSGAIKGWRVRFGRLVTLPERYDPNDPLAAARFADAMREAVAALLAE